MPGAKASNLETANRVFTIQGWIINGVQDYLILKQCQQQFLKSDGKPIGLRQAKNLLQKAYKVWHEEEEATIEQKRSLRIAELKQDIRSMKDEYKGTPKGMAVVNNIKKEISKLEALYPTPKLMLQGDRDNPVMLPDGFGPEKQARLEALIAKGLESLKK